MCLLCKLDKHIFVHLLGKFVLFTAECNPPFTLLNGPSGIDENDRCEVGKILHTQPKTIVFVLIEEENGR